MSYWPEHSNSNSDPRDLVLRGATPQPSAVYSYRQEGNAPRGQLLEYWDALRRKLVMVAVLAATGAGAGFLVAMLQHPLYRARTVLDIRNLNENIMNMREGGAATGVSATGLPESYLQTEIKILQSESILKRALERMPKLQARTPEDRSLSLFTGLVRMPGPKQSR